MAWNVGVVILVVLGWSMLVGDALMAVLLPLQLLMLVLVMWCWRRRCALGGLCLIYP